MKRHLLAALSLAFTVGASTVVCAQDDYQDYTVAAISPSIANSATVESAADSATGGSQESFETFCRQEDMLSSLFSDVRAGCACMDRVMHQVFTPDELGFVVSQIQTNMFDMENPANYDDETTHATFVAKLERSDEKLNVDCQAYLDTTEVQ